jgi:hypothetical protein
MQKNFKGEIEKIENYNANHIIELNNLHDEDKIKQKIELETKFEKKVMF